MGGRVLRKPSILKRRKQGPGGKRLRLFGKGRDFDYQGRVDKGESLSISSLPLSFWRPGSDYCILGDYWGRQTLACGKLDRITIDQSGAFLHLVLQGSDNQELVKWCGTAIKGGEVGELLVHLCPAGCRKANMSQDLLHGCTLVALDPEALWSHNIADLRGASPAMKGSLHEELERLADERGAPREEKRAPSPEAADARKDRTTGNKSFRETPLDPRVSLKKVLRRAREKKKSKKRGAKSRRRDCTSEESSSSRSNSSGSRSIDSQDSGHPFRESHRVHRISKKIPGALTRHALEEISRLLVEALGDQRGDQVRPLFLKYCRLHLFTKNVSPGQKREVLTLVHGLDRLVQRDLLGCADLLVQRLKAIELVLNGASWQVAQNIELVPLDQERISSVAEAQEATRAFKSDFKVQRDLGKGFKGWTPKGGEKGKTTKGKDGGKGGKGKEGTGALRTEPMRPQ